MHLSLKRFILFLFVSCLANTSTAIPLFSQEIIVNKHQSILLPGFNQGLLRGGKSKQTYASHFRNQTKNEVVLKQKSHQLELLRRSYKQSIEAIKASAASPSSKTLHIPRIVHQIWLGSPVPKKYQEWMSTWMNLQGWEYKLWTDKEVKQLKLVNQNIYDSVTNYGQKSDILRMELLYLMGGVYVDTDFECLKPNFFEVLHNSVDFYAGIEPLEHAFLRINNAIIGASAGHPLIEKMILDLPKHFEANKTKWALISTGPVFMTKVIYDYLEQDHSEVNMLLPCSLVYPFSSRDVDRSPSPDSLVPMKETAAIHYWSKSWVKK